MNYCNVLHKRKKLIKTIVYIINIRECENVKIILVVVVVVVVLYSGSWQS